MRLLSVSVAALAASALVVLGVMIGTDGLGLLGGERNPASVTLAPTAALVDLPPARPTLQSTDLRATLLSLLPPGALDAVSNDPAAAIIAPAAPAPDPAVPAPSPEAVPPVGPAPEPAPAPVPTDPLPVPVPAPPPGTEPVVGTVDQLVESVTGTLGL